MLMMVTKFLVGALPDTRAAVFDNLGPSLAASMAHGTTIAVPCRSGDEGECDGVLILTRTPKQSYHQVTNDVDPREQKLADLNVVLHDPLDFTDQSLHPRRWNIMGETSVVCMTGFSPEVHLLMRLLEEMVDVERQVMSSNVRDQTQSAASLVKSLAGIYQNAALDVTSRPLGVAVLLVGRSTDRRRWHIWTLDPAGNLQSHIGGAVIGKASPVILPKLRNIPGDTPRESLKQAMQVLRESLQDSSISTASLDSDVYEAILIHWLEDRMQVGCVSEKDIQACLHATSKKAS